MARGINKVILVGNLGQDAEMRALPNGGYVTNISLATSESWKDKQTGQTVDKTEWHRVIFFNRLAEIAGDYLKKGSQVYVEGKLQTRKWQAQDGSDRYSTEIVANEMQMLGSAGGAGAANAAGVPAAQQGVASAPPSQAGPASQALVNQQSNNGQANAPQAAPEDDLEDLDIPF